MLDTEVTSINIRTHCLWLSLYTEVLANVDLFSIWSDDRLEQIIGDGGYPGDPKHRINVIRNSKEEDWQANFRKLPPTAQEFMHQKHPILKSGKTRSDFIVLIEAAAFGT